MTEAVVVDQLIKAFGTTQALAGVSFSLPEGTVLGLLGPNGAGKTTAVRVLASLLRPEAGPQGSWGSTSSDRPSRSAG